MNQIFESVRLALASIWANKLRSVLTLLIHGSRISLFVGLFATLISGGRGGTPVPGKDPGVASKVGGRLWSSAGGSLVLTGLLGGTGEPAQQQNAALLNLCGDEFLRDQIHPVSDRRDHGDVSRLIHAYEPRSRHGPTFATSTPTTSSNSRGSTWLNSVSTTIFSGSFMCS